MKILVIHGSPRKGNTLKLTGKFEKAMKNAGSAVFEYLNVSELNIGMCRGCFSCITKGEDLCPLKNDDVKLVIKKTDEADGVVFSVPTYMFNAPAVMKNLIDRLAYLGHRPRYTGRHAVVISTTCGVGLNEAIKYLSFATAGAWGFRLTGTLGAYTHPFFYTDKSIKILDKKITSLAVKFYKDLSGKTMPPVKFGELMRFLSMKNHALYARETFPADYKFYLENSGVGKDYYLKSARIGILRRTAAKLLSFYIAMSMKKSRKKADFNRAFLDW